MIEKATAFKDSNGCIYPTLEEAQRAEISSILSGDETLSDIARQTYAHCAAVIVANQEKVIDILTTSESSRPKARKVNGGTKPRKARATTQTALA